MRQDSVSENNDIIRVVEKPVQKPAEPQIEKEKPEPVHAEKKPVILNEKILIPKEPVVEKTKVEVQPQVEVKQETKAEPVIAKEQVKIEASAQPKVEPKVEEPEKKKKAKVDFGFKLSVPLSDDQIDGIPSWAHPDFQCLFFNVGVVKLAVPLVKLKGVVPFPEKVARPPKSPDWYLGLYMNRGQHVKIIDTAELILPDGYNGKKEACEPNKVIFIGEGELGLVCSDIGDVVKLNESEVRWREQDNSKRPWLFGTVKKHLCALVDTAGIIKMLRQMGIEKD